MTQAHDPQARIALTRGSFSCAGDFAVEVAHMLSNAEACICSGAADVADVCDVLAEYLRGNKDASEAIELFDEWFKEKQPPVSELVIPESQEGEQ